MKSRDYEWKSKDSSKSQEGILRNRSVYSPRDNVRLEFGKNDSTSIDDHAISKHDLAEVRGDVSVESMEKLEVRVKRPTLLRQDVARRACIGKTCLY